MSFPDFAAAPSGLRLPWRGSCTAVASASRLAVGLGSPFCLTPLNSLDLNVLAAKAAVIDQ
jgi:hypothetical protein